MTIEVCSYSTDSVKRWSGGTTQELYISPKSASLQNRDFDFRISSATVEEEESVFSSFPGYLRKLLILEGELMVNHLDHHSVLLKPFEQDLFSGDWMTTSIGKVKDFNVIYKPHLNPTIELRRVGSSQFDLIDVKLGFLFLVKGKAKLDGTTLPEGSGVYLSAVEKLRLHFSNESSIVIVRFDEK